MAISPRFATRTLLNLHSAMLSYPSLPCQSFVYPAGAADIEEAGIRLPASLPAAVAGSAFPFSLFSFIIAEPTGFCNHFPVKLQILAGSTGSRRSKQPPLGEKHSAASLGSASRSLFQGDHYMFSSAAHFFRYARASSCSAYYQRTEKKAYVPISMEKGVVSNYESP